MIITDQVFNQAELLVGETDPAGRELLGRAPAGRG